MTITEINVTADCDQAYYEVLYSNGDRITRTLSFPYYEYQLDCLNDFFKEILNKSEKDSKPL